MQLACDLTNTMATEKKDTGSFQDTNEEAVTPQLEAMEFTGPQAAVASEFSSWRRTRSLMKQAAQH